MAQGVINIIREWLLGPDAPREECRNCEMLQEQLAFANYDRKMLLEHFVSAVSPRKETDSVVDEEDLKPIRMGAKSIPWRVRQEQLEKDSRERARMSKGDGKPKINIESIEKLETELGLQQEKENVGTGQAVQGS